MQSVVLILRSIQKNSSLAVERDPSLNFVAFFLPDHLLGLPHFLLVNELLEVHFSNVAEEKIVESSDVGIGSWANNIGGGMVVEHHFKGGERGFSFLFTEIQTLNLQNSFKFHFNLKILNGVLLKTP